MKRILIFEVLDYEEKISGPKYNFFSKSTIQIKIDAAVVNSALIAVFYTWIEGLHSVAFIDIV